MNDIEAFFARLGWEKIDKFAGQPIFRNDYSAISLIGPTTSKKVRDEWSRWQTNLFEMRKDPSVGERKDMYLLMVVEDENQVDAISLQSIADDTFVCRKIILKSRGRTVPAILAELPLLQPISSIEASDEVVDVPSEFAGEGQLLNDLAKKSASAILDGLITGKYGRPNET